VESGSTSTRGTLGCLCFQIPLHVPRRPKGRRAIGPAPFCVLRRWLFAESRDRCHALSRMRFLSQKQGSRHLPRRVTCGAAVSLLGSAGPQGRGVAHDSEWPPSRIAFNGASARPRRLSVFASFCQYLRYLRFVMPGQDRFSAPGERANNSPPAPRKRAAARPPRN
jgi:hypothetical protein